MEKYFDIYGVKIPYDPTKNYGISNSRENYGLLPVETLIPTWAKAEKKDFLEFLASEIGRQEQSEIVKEIVSADILNMTGTSEKTGRISKQSQEIQNTIDLFNNIINTLKENEKNS